MDNTVTEEELDYVADHVSPWDSRRLLRKLGLTDVTIDQVFDDFKDEGSREKLYQGLRKCKEHKGSGFTLYELLKALEAIRRADLIENLAAKLSQVVILVLAPGLTKSFVGSDAKSIQSMIESHEEKMTNKKGRGQPRAFPTYDTDETLK